MKKIFQYIAMAVALVAMASCSQEETFEPDAPKVVKGMEFVVSDFPAYDDPQTRTIGIPEDGKTEWEEGDEILMIFDSPKYGVQSAALRYTESQWMLPEGVTFKYLEGETPEISALYSPICEVSGGMFVTADEYGTTECLWGSCNLSADGTSINISFGGRTSSRLRIAEEVGQELPVTTTDFTPAGAASAATGAYTLIANANGNAYLYGIFAEGATVSVKDGSIPIVDYTFSKEVHPNGTIAGKSYALDARPVIDGTLGGKAEATDAEVEDLVQQLKDYADSGITTIIVTGVEPALIDVSGIIMPAVSEAIYRLTDSGYYDENNPYNGKIDLILQDVTEIMALEFYTAFALNSITLPKVTTIGDEAFQGCAYMKQITFGSVVTSIVVENGVTFFVGYKVGGCDLVLNCGQLEAEDTYKPDLENNVWFKPSWGGNVTWKSITLTHTGENSECDECKKLQ